MVKVGVAIRSIAKVDWSDKETFSRLGELIEIADDFTGGQIWSRVAEIEVAISARDLQNFGFASDASPDEIGVGAYGVKRADHQNE